MANVLFTHSYFLRFDPKQWKQQQPYPPLGTLYAAAVLREGGHQVSFFDTMFSEKPEEIILSLEKEKPKYLVIYDDGFNYLTKMCLTKMREAAYELAKYGKQYNCTIIICSSDSSDHYEKYLHKGVDFVMIGEGENTLKELVENLEKKSSDFEKIEGLAFQRGNKIVKTNKRAVIHDIDSLPLPAWDLADINKYKKIWKKYHGYFSLNIATTRGCPFKCNWCAKPIYGNRYNSRSPQNVVSEIEFLFKNYQPEHFWICDDIFGLKPGWVQEFRNSIKEKKINFRYKIQSRVDLLLQEDTMDALAESGLETVWVGAESGSQKILDAMEKGTTVEQIYLATKLIQSKKIKVGFFLQFGYLGETKNDIDQTIKMLLELMPDDIGVSISYPLPGTKFYEKVKDDLKEKSNWVDSDDLAMLFHNNFEPAYYKRLHRYVHKLFRRKQSLLNLKIFYSAFLTLPKFELRKQVRNILSVAYYTLALPIDYLKLKKYSANKPI